MRGLPRGNRVGLVPANFPHTQNKRDKTPRWTYDTRNVPLRYLGGARLPGAGGNILIIDDPLKSDEHSPKQSVGQSMNV